MKVQTLGLALILGVSALTALPASADDPSHLSGQDWRMQHLDANGMAKCRAFRRVRQDTGELQKARGGRLTLIEQKRLESELKRANAMAPASVTPAQCGVPL
jgi:hypothetical protein